MQFFKYFYDIFLEARRNFFPKQTVLEILEKYKDQEDILVSFRDDVTWTSQKNDNIEKKIKVSIGINPRNNYNTPTGIYSYVLKPLWKQFSNNNLPFANRRPTIVVFKPDLDSLKGNDKILRSSSFSEKDYDDCVNRIKKLLNYTDADIESVLSTINSSYKNTLFRTFWSLLREISINNTKDLKKSAVGGKRYTNYWTTLLIKLGFPVIIDDAGTSTIHGNEPVQAFVAGKKYTKVLEVIENKNWSKIGAASSDKIINKIIDTIYYNNSLIKWKNVLNSLHKDIKNKLIYRIVSNPSTMKNLKTQDCEILRLQDFLPDSNTYLTTLHIPIANKELVDYLLHFINRANVCNFLYFYITRNNSETISNKNLSLIVNNIFKNPSEYKDYNSSYFTTVKKIIALSDNKDKMRRFILFKLLKGIFSKGFPENMEIFEVIGDILVKGNIGKNDSIWSFFQKNKEQFSEQIENLVIFYIKSFIKTDVVLKDECPDWFIQKVITEFNEKFTDDLTLYFSFVRHNIFVIDSFNLEKTCEFLLQSSLFNSDSNVLERCLKRLNTFSKEEVVKMMELKIQTISSYVSDSTVVDNFKNIPQSLQKFLLKDHPDVSDFIIRCYLKNSTVDVKELQDLVGQDNLSEWVQKNKSKLFEYTYSSDFINTFSNDIDFSGQSDIRFFFHLVGMKRGFDNIFQYIKYFCGLNSYTRRELLKYSVVSHITHDIGISGVDYNRLFKYCDDLLNQQTDADTVVEKCREFLLKDAGFINNLFYIIQYVSNNEFDDVTVLKSTCLNIFPIIQLTYDNKNTLTHLLSEYTVYDSNMKKVSTLNNIPAYQHVYLNKNDIIKILKLSNKKLPDDFLTSKPATPDYISNALLNRKAYFGKYQHNNQTLVPAIDSRHIFLSIAQNPSFKYQEIFQINSEDDVQLINFEDKLEYPLFITEEYYSSVVKPLPEDYYEYKNGEKDKIDEHHKQQYFDYLKSKPFSKRIFTNQNETYISFPSNFLLYFGLFEKDLKALVNGYIQHFNPSTDYGDNSYIELEHLESLIGPLPLDLKENNIDKDVIQRMIDAMQEGVPNDLKNAKPVKTMFYNNRQLVLLGKGLGPDKNWRKELKLENDTGIYEFINNNWYSGYDGYTPDVYCALEKTEWEKITKVQVPESYYEIENNNDNDVYIQKLLKVMNQIPEYIKESKPDYMIHKDGEKLVYIGQGITEGWRHVFHQQNKHENIKICKWNKIIKKWGSLEMEGNLDNQLYAVEKSTWENFTKHIVPDSYYQTSSPEEIKQHYKKIMMENFENVPEVITSMTSTTQDGEKQLVFLGKGLAGNSMGKNWFKILNDYVYRWIDSEEEWYDGFLGDSADYYYAVEKSTWEKFTGVSIPENYYNEYKNPFVKNEIILYKNILLNSMNQLPNAILDCYNKSIKNLLIRNNGDQLVFLGKGITEGWKDALSSNNVMMFIDNPFGDIWSKGNKKGDVSSKYYAVLKQDWEAYTKQKVSDDYYNAFIRNNSEQEQQEVKI